MILNDSPPSDGNYQQAVLFVLRQIPKEYNVPISKSKFVTDIQSTIWQETFRENAENALYSIVEKIEKGSWQPKNLTDLHKQVLNVRNCLGKTTRSFLLIMNHIEPLMEQAEKTTSEAIDQEVTLPT